MTSSPPEQSAGAGERDGGLAEAAMDTLPGEVAVLDGDGVIVRTNEAWAQFGEDNEYDGDSVGTNYLAVGDVDDEYAQQAVDGIRDVLAGDRDDYELEYPCHSPDERRWFLMRAVPFDHRGDRYVTVSHLDITDRRLAEEAVEDANAELTDQREQLALLNQVVRHDIRNDMNVVAGLAAEAASAVEGPAADLVDRIRTTAEHVTDLTQVVGEIATLVADDDGADLEPVDAGRVLRQEARKLAASYEERSESVSVRGIEAVPDGVVVRGDELLSSVFGNLLTNAVVHNDAAEPAVAVALAAADDAARVRVADNGSGVPPDQREAIFGRGEKGLGSPGSGLGLYLVDRLVERYGGTVRVEEADPDADGVDGAVFVVELPLAEA